MHIIQDTKVLNCPKLVIAQNIVKTYYVFNYWKEKSILNAYLGIQKLDYC